MSTCDRCGEELIPIVYESDAQRRYGKYSPPETDGMEPHDCQPDAAYQAADGCDDEICQSNSMLWCAIIARHMREYGETLVAEMREALKLAKVYVDKQLPRQREIIEENERLTDAARAVVDLLAIYRTEKPFSHRLATPHDLAIAIDALAALMKGGGE